MTTDWTKQTEEMVKNWTTVQQKMMESMMGMMGMNTMGTMPTDIWGKTISTLHGSMKSALEAQVNWTQFMADTMSANSGSSKQVSDMASQAVDMTKRWSDAQAKVLDTWFDTMKQTDPTTIAKSMNPEEMMKSLQNWQTASQKMMETQMEMIRSMTSAVPGGTSTSAKK